MRIQKLPKKLGHLIYPWSYGIEQETDFPLLSKTPIHQSFKSWDEDGDKIRFDILFILGKEHCRSFSLAFFLILGREFELRAREKDLFIEKLKGNMDY
ncbi:hypothetical protein Tco_1093768 [Tanacetum coccineum]|uniref:Uncharacterized protein n=1 Tax=Tanacetum coccineum TaxID=301880 RepID=A0ABQ5IEW6_9ASTR